MDRNKLIDLFQRGLQYPPGKHRFWISRCFEITVRPDWVVELDEYESFVAEKEAGTRRKPKGPKDGREMFHVGRSVVNLKDGGITEEQGEGWGESEKSSKNP